MVTFKISSASDTGFGSNQYGNTVGDCLTTHTVDWRDFYQYRQPYREPIDYRYQPVTYITGTVEETKKKEKNMKNFYHVFVVDLDEKILVDEKVVAKNEDDAKFCFDGDDG